MRVVLDTNVLVSGLITPEGPCGRILRLLADDVLQVCVDERILAEYEAVLRRPEFRIDSEDIAWVLDVIRENGEAFSPMPMAAKLPDPRDVCFLEVAVAGEAILVTGNIRHFPSHARAGARVLTPREFLDHLAM